MRVAVSSLLQHNCILLAGFLSVHACRWVFVTSSTLHQIILQDARELPICAPRRHSSFVIWIRLPQRVRHDFTEKFWQPIRTLARGMATVLRRWGSGCLASSSSTASADLTHCASASPSSPRAGKSSTSSRWRVGGRLLRGARWRFYRSEHRIDRSASLLILHDFIFELCVRGYL